MILAIHLIIGAVLMTKIKFLPLAALSAFLSHYFFDCIWHEKLEYSILNIKSGKWRESGPDFIKVAIDILIGLLLIYIFISKEAVLLIGAFFAILPDGLTLLYLLFPNKLLEAHEKFHKAIQNETQKLIY